MSVTTIHHYDEIDFSRPGKSHYEVAFHHDGTWGNVLVPLTVINGLRGPGKTVACFGGTHRNRLFMAASKSIYALYVNTQGVAGG